MKITKQELRRQYRAIRNAFSAVDRHRESRKVCEQLAGLHLYTESDAVLCYLSYGSEFETDSLIHKALNDGKKVAVPVIQGTEMLFCRIYADTEYQQNGYGISEPVSKEIVQPELCTSVLLILPGLCYDREGGRIGYGGGYYDRYIAAHGTGSRLHVVFPALSCQYYDGRIPMEKHDIRPDVIIDQEGMKYVCCK